MSETEITHDAVTDHEIKSSDGKQEDDKWDRLTEILSKKIEMPAQPKRDNQLKEVLRKSDIMRDLITLKRGQLKDIPSGHNWLRDSIEKMVKEDKPDHEIYASLHVDYRGKIDGKGAGQAEVQHIRSAARTVQFEGTLREHSAVVYRDPPRLQCAGTEIPMESLLDIGCGDGKITTALAELLGVPKEKTFGCDIYKDRDIVENLNFTLLDDKQKVMKLPFEDNSISIVIAFMSLHHMRQLPSMISEISRILSQKGVLVIREHDCRDSLDALLWDVVHGFHAMVWKEHKENENFGEEYFALYRPRAEWREILKTAGLQCLEPRNPQNYKTPLRAYHAFFFKGVDIPNEENHNRHREDNSRNRDNRRNDDRRNDDRRNVDRRNDDRRNDDRRNDDRRNDDRRNDDRRRKPEEDQVRESHDNKRQRR